MYSLLPKRLHLSFNELSLSYLEKYHLGAYLTARLLAPLTLSSNVPSDRGGTAAYLLPDPRIETQLFGQALEFGRRRKCRAVELCGRRASQEAP